MDAVTWAALTLTLTLLFSAYAWWAFRHRGLAPGIRGIALALLPAAAWLTGTLEMFTEIATSVSHWASRLVLSPRVWVGIGAAGLATLLFLVSRVVDARRPRARVGGGRTRGAVTGGATPAPGAAKPAAAGDEFSEIEELLRRKGIQ